MEKGFLLLSVHLSSAGKTRTHPIDKFVVKDFLIPCLSSFRNLPVIILFQLEAQLDYFTIYFNHHAGFGPY